MRIPMRFSRALIVTTTIILGALVLLPACSRDDSPRDGTRRIDFWHIQTYDPVKPVIDSAVARTISNNERLEIRTQAIENDTFKTKLDTAFGARTQPDVFHTWGGGRLGEYATYGLVMDLTGKLDTGHLHPAAIDFCTIDEKLYAMPVDVSFVPMWYNRDLFAQAGVAEPPRTMEQFHAVCEALKAAGITPIALGNADSWPGAFYFIYLATRYGGTAPIANRDFEHASFIEAGESIQQLVNAGVFNRGFNGISYDEARRIFFNGEAAMMLMGTWLEAHVRDRAPDLLPKLGTFAFPAVGRDAEADATLVGGVNAGYAISANTGHPEGSLALLEHLGDDVALTAWAATGRLPALTREAWRERLGEPPAMAEILFASPRLQLYYDQLLPAHLATEHKQTTQALFALEMTPAAAAKAMTETSKKQQ